MTVAEAEADWLSPGGLTDGCVDVSGSRHQKVGAKNEKKKTVYVAGKSAGGENPNHKTSVSSRPLRHAKITADYFQLTAENPTRRGQRGWKLTVPRYSPLS